MRNSYTTQLILEHFITYNETSMSTYPIILVKYSRIKNREKKLSYTLFVVSSLTQVELQ